MNYNSADDSLAGPNGDAMLDAAAEAWTGLASSTFAFDADGLTSHCPSLVKECRGRQKTDGFNDFAWMNINFSWASGGINDVDAQTVIQHGLGHVLGLGHSAVSGALMEPVYEGVRGVLTADDIAGITLLYPSGPVDPQRSARSPALFPQLAAV